MRTAALFAAYAAFAAAQDLDSSVVADIEPIATPSIPVVYSYSANYLSATASASAIASIVDYNSASAAASVSAGVAVSATVDSTTTASATSTASNSKRDDSGSCSALLASGSTYTSKAGKLYEVDCGYDYAGADLAAASVSQFSDCFAKCDAYPGCASFAYLPGTCYMKRRGGGKIANSGVNAGALVNQGTGDPNMCAAQPAGIAHLSVPDDATTFVADAFYSAAALAATTPSGYFKSFTNLQASNVALGYLGYTLLSSYDTASCASQCTSISGCSSFNIYYERNPSVDPNDSSCSNPASFTKIKCVFWGGPVTTANAVNGGQYRNQFRVVVAGNNGYTSTAVGTPAGYTDPSYLGNAIISAPATTDCAGGSIALDNYIWSTGPFDANLCATACNTYNSKQLGQTCSFFNTYVISKNGAVLGQYCQLYSQSFDSSYATNTGTTVNGDKFTYTYSFSSSNSTNAGGPKIPCNVAAASSAIGSASLQPYCSTLLGYFPSTATVTATSSITAVTTVVSTVVTTATVGGNAKRAMATPSALTSFPASVISSACSLQASAVTGTTTVTGATTTITAATSTSTTLTTVTSTTSTTPAAAATPLSIYSAYYADKDVTNAARSVFASGNNLVINSNTFASAFGDPWAGTLKSFVMLYTYGNEIRVFTTQDSKGTFTITPGPISSAPNSVLAPLVNSPPGSNVFIYASTYGPRMVTASSTYSTLYSDATSGTAVAFSNAFFGFDSLPGTIKSSVTFYRVNGQFRVLAGREYASATFNTAN